MAGYPSLKPAFTIKVTISQSLDVGSHHRNANLKVVPMVGGTLTGEPGFEPLFNAEFVGTGNDYIRFDPDRQRMRLDAHGVVKTEDGALIYLHYNGTVRVTAQVASILTGKAEDLVTPFGDSFTDFTFETGDERYKELENGIFVAQGRFVAAKGQAPVVEYRVSQVVQG